MFSQNSTFVLCENVDCLGLPGYLTDVQIDPGLLVITPVMGILKLAMKGIKDLQSFTHKL